MVCRAYNLFTDYMEATLLRRLHLHRLHSFELLFALCCAGQHSLLLCCFFCWLPWFICCFHIPLLMYIERATPMSKIWQYLQQVRVARFTSTQQQSCLRQHSTLIGKVHLPFSNQPSHFLPQRAVSMSSSAFLSLTFYLKI